MFTKPVNYQYWFLRNDPPSEWMHSMNDALHKDDKIFIIVHGLFWSCILFLIAPFAGGAVLIGTTLRLMMNISGYSTQTVSLPSSKKKNTKKTNDDSDTSTTTSQTNRTITEKAVVITGCDSGFGKDFAMVCAEKGYHVFAACLQKESLAAFQGQYNENMTPLIVDVCRDDHVTQMAKVVLDWVKTDPKHRFLHAVVNNAGIGYTGLVDWLDIEAYERSLQVNCLGQIRVTKAFLPFLKEQALIPFQDKNDARIVNMVSMASMMVSPGMTPYFTSKYAAEGFSNALRLELRDFGIKVITMNPSFHSTPLTEDMGGALRRYFAQLPPALKEKYGVDYIEKNMIPLVSATNSIMWHRENVVRDLSRAVDFIHPRSRYVTGMDSFGLLVLRMLPDAVQSFLIPRYLHPPAFYGEKKEKQS